MVGYGHEDYGEGNYISHYINGVSLIPTDFTCGIQFDASSIFAKGSFWFDNKISEMLKWRNVA